MSAKQDKIAPSAPASAKDKQRKKLTVITPGSTANLGPGFDALALALNVHCRLTFELLEQDDRSIPLITIKDSGSKDFCDGLKTDDSNLIYATLRALWADEPSLLNLVRITIESNIPLGRGLGSSAAAIMGTVFAASALRNQIQDKGVLLAQAAGIEGHGDNVAASLYGGLVVCGHRSGTGGVITQKLKWPSNWCPVLVVPNYELSTKKAREILPAMVPRGDAVSNVQNVALLLSAVNTEDEEALQAALHDRLHEPYREQLVPELPAVRKAVSDIKVLGTVLSGAGSSVLTLVARRHLNQAFECLTAWSKRQTHPPKVLSLQVDQEGLRAQYEK